MGRYVFRLPDIGEGVAQAEIVAWRVKVGDKVEEDQPLADVMTDKATVELTSPVDGVVVSLGGDVGDKAPVGSSLVEFEVEGAGNVKEAPAAASAAKPAKTAQESPAETPPPVPIASDTPAPPLPPPPIASGAPGPLAAPATRKRARDLGVTLDLVPGTGPGGRILRRDLEAFVERGGAPDASQTYARRTGTRDTRIVGLRRLIAERMQESKQRIPHFSYVEEFDMTTLEALRNELNQERAPNQPKLTLLPFFMRAMVRLQPEFPKINARYDDEAGVLHEFDALHIGIAAQTPNGLMVPVVRHAETLDLWGCAREIARLSAAARDGTISREELTGSTITLTSLGALGGIMATPVINAPEVAILGPNKLQQRQIVLDGQPTIRTMMNFSTSFDHRIVDGFEAASYVQRLKRLIEQPARIFID